MIVITDSNIIVSALIKPNGAIASIFKQKSKIQFFAPDFLLIELKNHLPRIAKISDLNSKELNSEIEFLKERISFISIEKIPKKYIREAYEIVKDIDIDDTFFVALNIYSGYKIWTTDNILKNGLINKGYNICITTAELRKFLFKKL